MREIGQRCRSYSLMWMFLIITNSCFFVATAKQNKSDVTLDCVLYCGVNGVCAVLPGNQESWSLEIQSGRMVMECKCDPGYSGTGCTVKQPTCLAHFGVCSQDKKRSCTVDLDCYDPCEREKAVSKFAGMMCEKPYTEYCGHGFTMTEPLSFCTNGGKCKNDLFAARMAPKNTAVIDDFQNKGCDCPPEFFGDSCQFLRQHHNDLYPMNMDSDEDTIQDTYSKHWGLFTWEQLLQRCLEMLLGTCILCFILIVIGWFHYKGRHLRFHGVPTTDERTVATMESSKHEKMPDIAFEEWYREGLRLNDIDLKAHGDFTLGKVRNQDTWTNPMESAGLARPTTGRHQENCSSNVTL